MDDPRYGTVPTKDLPTVDVSKGVQARVLAGPAWDVQGPFATVQNVQMIDFELQPGSATDCLDILDEMDTAMLYVYEGELEKVNNLPDPVKEGHIVLFDADSKEQRGLEFSTSPESAGKAILFVGKKLKEPIAWHGPIVMNTQQQIQETIRELRSGNFPPVRVDWDYKHIATKPS